MNNGAYSSQDAAVLGPKIEEVVRADLGAAAPVPFQVLSGDGKTLTAGTMLADTAKYIFGGKEALLMTVAFDIQQPRPVSLQVCLNRQGVGAHIGSVLYKAKIAKPITGEVTLEDPKMFGTSKFIGDATAAAKLNANKDLLKHAGKFARTESPNLKVKAPRFFQVKPEDGGAAVTATSLARSYAMGLKVSLDVKEFIEIVGLIEASSDPRGGNGSGASLADVVRRIFGSGPALNLLSSRSMDDLTPQPTEPLPYATEWRGPNRLDALNAAVFIAGILLAVVPLVPSVWFVTRPMVFGLRLALTLASIAAHMALLIGSVLGLLQVRAGRWVTAGSLVAVSACGVSSFFMLTIPAVRPALRTTGGAAMYYVSYSSLTVWVLAFTAVSSVALFRRR